jgi:hypothetical protein
MLPIQYDFFESEEESEMSTMKKLIENVKNSSDNVRKGIFARHGELYKLFMDVDQRLKIIEKHLCTK